jgi:hypothetical protein
MIAPVTAVDCCASRDPEPFLHARVLICDLVRGLMCVSHTHIISLVARWGNPALTVRGADNERKIIYRAGRQASSVMTHA